MRARRLTMRQSVGREMPRPRGPRKSAASPGAGRYVGRESAR